MSKRMVVTHIRYDKAPDGELIVFLYGRGEDGNRITHILKNTQPHFFVASTETIPKRPEIQSIEPGFVSIFGKPLTKINVRYPFDVPKLREKLEHYEADITYDNRIRYDYNIKGQIIINDDGTVIANETDDIIKPRVSFIDIEVDTSKAGWTPDVPEGEILSMSLVDQKTEQVFLLLNTAPHPMRKNFLEAGDVAQRVQDVLTKLKFNYKVKIILCSSEKNLLERYKSYLSGPHSPDVLAAWNGWKYDYKYIDERLKRNKLPIPKGIAKFDYMYGYSVLYRTTHGELESRSLQSCANRELGTGKVELPGDIYSTYRADVGLFSAYNIIDSALMNEMDKKVGVILHYQTLSEITGVSLDRINAATRIVENMVFFLLRGTRIKLPSGPDYHGDEDDVDESKGAEVLSPSRGIFTNVLNIDLKSEYPNIIRTFNLSPETIFGVDKGNSFKLPYKIPETTEVPEQLTFSVREPRGVLPRILDSMMIKRDAMKAEMKKFAKGSDEYEMAFRKQEAFKYVMNSVFGVTDNNYFRLKSNAMFNNITAVGRLHIKWVAEQVKNAGLQVLTGDTDSVLCKFSEDLPMDEIVKRGQELVNKINESFKDFAAQFDATEYTLKIDFKKVYSKWFQGGKKKRYAGVVVWEGKPVEPQIEITGFDAKRSSTPIWTRETQRELLWKLLTEDKASVEKYLKEKYQDFVKGRVEIEKIGIPISMTRDAGGYKGNPIHIRAISYSNAYLGREFGRGSKIKYYFVKSVKDKPPTDVVAFDVDEKVPLDLITIDMKEHIRRCFIQPFEPIVFAVGLTLDSITEKKTVIKLSDFEEKPKAAKPVEINKEIGGLSVIVKIDDDKIYFDIK